MFLVTNNDPCFDNCPVMRSAQHGYPAGSECAQVVIATVVPTDDRQHTGVAYEALKLIDIVYDAHEVPPCFPNVFCAYQVDHFISVECSLIL